MTGNFPLKSFFNGEALPLADVPRVSHDDFFQTIIDATDRGWRIVSYFGDPGASGVTLYCILALTTADILGIMRTDVTGSFPSVAGISPQVHLFEREIAEQCGITAEGHPWFKPVRFQPPLRTPGGTLPGIERLPGVMDYYRVEGEEVHEVAVGPVHAGIIEPGHFRFQCHGEQVFHLEISLGYQHRGIEAGLPGGPHPTTIHQMETVAGDTSIGHADAYAMVIEGLSGCLAPPRAEALRGVALELERLANHTGDLGAIAGDVAYLPTASFCGRIRGDFLNMTALICGSRFGRGLVRPGGTGFDLGQRQVDDLLRLLDTARNDLTSAVQLLWDTQSVMGRLEGTGRVTTEAAQEIGLVGPAARACGLNRDVRQDLPWGIYRMSQVPVVTEEGGDVLARTQVRWLEAEKSLDFLNEQLRQLPGGSIRSHCTGLAGDSIAVALTEGWRGEICHAAITDAGGRIHRYKITDPSFHNWFGLALALRNGQISDFPLCNKSFNLSYCGFDL